MQKLLALLKYHLTFETLFPLFVASAFIWAIGIERVIYCSVVYATLILLIMAKRGIDSGKN